MLNDCAGLRIMKKWEEKEHLCKTDAGIPGIWQNKTMHAILCETIFNKIKEMRIQVVQITIHQCQTGYYFTRFII